MIGRIVPIKDTRTFIMAASLLKDMVPNVVAILIGPEEEDPSYAAGCRELVAQLGLESTVQFLGRVPDVMEYLGKADVIALTSISEAQPIALLEAAATGLPAVTTDVGSCREIIEGFDGDRSSVEAGSWSRRAIPGRRRRRSPPSCSMTKCARTWAGSCSERIPNLYNKNRIRRLYEELYAGLAPELSPATG